jgi:cbb3-type cytochrome oxidase maturation protein
MDILYLLVPLSVVLVFAIAAVFWLALSGGQFDDLDAPAFRILADDDSADAAGFDPSQIRPPPGP